MLFIFTVNWRSVWQVSAYRNARAQIDMETTMEDAQLTKSKNLAKKILQRITECQLNPV